MKKKFRILVHCRHIDSHSDVHSLFEPISWGYGISISEIPYHDFDTIKEAEEKMKEIFPSLNKGVELTIIPIYTHDTGAKDH